jgi:hypothetical protein
MTENLKDKPLNYTEGAQPQQPTTPTPTPAPTPTPTPPPTPTPTTPPSGGIDQQLVGAWDNKLALSDPLTRSVFFFDDGTFGYSNTGGAFSIYLTGTYEVSNGWITLSNVVAKWGSGIVEEDWLKTYKVEYSFETDPYYLRPDETFVLKMGILSYRDKPEIPLDGYWGIWHKRQ